MIDKSAIEELNRLWVPVRPYLARFVSDVYGRHDGNVLELGPFSGLAFELARHEIGVSFRMAVFPSEVAGALKQEAQGLRLEDKVFIEESDERLTAVPQGKSDLIVFRGAFFFPSFFTPDLTAVYRSLSPGGTALVGGGFGPHTPEAIIKAMERRSKELNQAVGRVRITEENVRSTVEAARLTDRATIITEGGLWVVLKKENAR